MELTERLNTDADSPWRGDIAVIGVPAPRYKIRDSVFAYSLTYILRDRVMMAMPLERLLSFLKTYWSAIKQAMGDIWDQRSYYLRRVQGVYPMHMVFPEVYGRLAGAGYEFNEEILTRLFKEVYTILKKEYGEVWTPKGPAIFTATEMKSLRAVAEKYLGPAVEEAFRRIGIQA